jgi:hypothetical protein
MMLAVIHTEGLQQRGSEQSLRRDRPAARAFVKVLELGIERAKHIVEDRPDHAERVLQKPRGGSPAAVRAGATKAGTPGTHEHLQRVVGGLFPEPSSDQPLGTHPQHKYYRNTCSAPFGGNVEDGLGNIS